MVENVELSVAINEAKAAFLSDFTYLETVLLAGRDARKRGFPKSPKSVQVEKSPKSVHVEKSPKSPTSEYEAALAFLDSVSDRLAQYVRIVGGCWVWSGSLTGGGQPMLRIGPQHKVTPIRRHLFEVVNGPLDGRRQARSLESCKAHCVRPEHTRIKGFNRA